MRKFNPAVIRARSISRVKKKDTTTQDTTTQDTTTRRKTRRFKSPDRFRGMKDAALHDEFQEVPASERTDPNSVYVVPETWEKPGQLKAPPIPEKLVREIEDGTEFTDQEGEELPTRVKKLVVQTVIPAAKKRTTSVSVSMSPEEKYLIQKHVYTRGLKVSEWARKLMFDAANIKTPDR